MHPDVVAVMETKAAKNLTTANLMDILLHRTMETDSLAHVNPGRVRELVKALLVAGFVERFDTLGPDLPPKAA